jgi:transglutaminase-like putative cysteine protease
MKMWVIRLLITAYRLLFSREKGIMRLQTRPIMTEGWSTLLLLWAMLLVATIGIMQADLIGGLQILPIVATLALLAGLFLSKSIFSDRTAHLFSLVYGLFFVSVLVASILPPEIPWRERVIDLFGRQFEWLQQAVGGGTSRDGIIFVIQTAAVFWILGYLSAWYTYRRPHVWRVVLPTGIVLLSVVYYYNGPRPLAIYLALYILLALIFVARTHLAAEEKGWRSAAVRYESAIRFDFIRAGLMAALLALLVAYAMPTLSASAAVGDALSGAGGPWRSFQDNWTRLFSSLRSYGTGTSDPYQDTLVLGGPRTVGNTLIMDVQVPQQLAYGYWHAIAYDTYVDGRWEANFISGEPLLHYPDDGVLTVPFTLSREVVTQTVTNYLPNSSFLYGAPEVVGTSRQMYVETAYDENNNLLVSSLRSRFVLRPGDQYQVVSRMSTVDATSLRSSSTAYPAWIQERYLQLPETVSPETVQLANEVTAGLTNPFDMALAIRDHLRARIVYNDQIPAPPQDVDPVHHTLFVSQEGYCNYYASAMAVMLRSLGVPARVVSGYTLGEFDEAARVYRVRASNAHTWVEVYFPGYGWLEFEPTATVPVVERPQNAAGGDAFATASIPNLADREALLPPDDVLSAGDEGLAGGLPLNTGQRGFLAGVSPWTIGITAAILLIAAVIMVMAQRLNARVEADVDRSYGRLGGWARWLGITWRPTQTPYEQADLLVSAVPEGQAPVRNLTRQYVRKQFSPERSVEEGFDPAQEWKSLRPVLLRHSAAKFLDRLNRRSANGRYARDGNDGREIYTTYRQSADRHNGRR